jgi:hypothetical protein
MHVRGLHSLITIVLITINIRHAFLFTTLFRLTVSIAWNGRAADSHYLLCRASGLTAARVNKRRPLNASREQSPRVLCAVTTNMNQTIQQLESARALTLGDGNYYPTIIPGVLPIIGYSADQSIEIQRWGADFLAEAFSSPAWSSEEKQKSASPLLPTLRDYLEHVADKAVVKSVVQAAASIYPLVYRHV